MTNQLSHLIALTEVATRTAKTSRKVISRVESGLCLAPGCECVARTRGLCVKHYRSFMRNRDRKDSKAKRAEFELDCIEQGLILEIGQFHKIKNKDPFSQVA